ncbi:uncharacterized protein Z518_08410 [Rhinocladiella mackenziei CBS 650.93]|uniref:Chromatin remodeling complex subunit n=1 Tax=Rhinocladiella mackenziei CBS 650.93 TaxID=1442369 RepID=A0A0D2I9H0_9EURO|nr:uncharacterized protein Z518_08410 [Rhinocladiella mackenziei CBS 650.93]KIX02469.1 hypothetical protein Z518_08410 [Rhinocladiella mackenziei CBS 650.93]
MPPFKDEHVLIIAPGSQITAAQLGLPESFTPPRYRFPTRMFPGTNPGEWEPVKIRSKITTVPKSSEPATNGQPSATNGEPVPSTDVEMSEAPPAVEEAAKPDAETQTEPQAESLPSDTAQQEPQDAEEETTETFEDDHWSTEGAVYPIQEGRIENWSCFFALLSHIYNMISPPFHMPVLFVSQPCWSERDHEMITQYVFENWKIPAFCLMDAALTAAWAYGVPSALVVDVGHGKCDVTAVTEFQVNHIGRGVAISGCGGQAMTKRLQQGLESQGFDEDMAEQLKKSPICEILPAGTPLPQAAANRTAANPAAAASTGALDSGMNAKDVDGLRPGQALRGPGIGTTVGEEGANGEDEDKEGVLDVAAIVARDNAAEVLAKREKEKVEKAAAKKGGAAEAPKQIRLRNSERERATFTYVDYVPVDDSSAKDAEPMSRKRKREIEVGVERFMAASPPPGMSDGIIDIIAEAIHHTILSVPEVNLRSTLWDNLIILGNGSRIRGFTSSLLSVLNARYILSPSTATIFTSELPSNFSTPVATPGTNTPIPGQGSYPLHHPGGHGVNPLLVAATKNMMQPNQHLQVPGQIPPIPDPNMHHSHRGYSQSPTSIKTVKPPDYFPEWKDPSVSGMEEAAFLGAQVAAKVVFIVDQGNSKGFLTRSEYNDLGPAGIHDCAM